MSICFAVLFGGGLHAAFGMSESLPLSIAILVVDGFCPAIFINFVSALLQENTEPRMMGRVMSMYSLAFLASTPFGNVQAGIIANFYGPQAALVAGGLTAATIGLGCLFLLRPVTRLS